MSIENSPDIPTTVPQDHLPRHLLDKLKIEVPGYKLLSIVGRGGQAVVYKAVRESTGKAVAIKLLREGPLADEWARERLQRETAVLAALDHPNIVTIIDRGQTAEGYDYLVMNYIAGELLDVRARDGADASQRAADPSAMLKLFVKICSAVNAAHLQGIVHRDLSPSNILVDEYGEPHILDFGLARTAFDRFLGRTDENISIDGQFLGKVAYASPEQARGDHQKIDIRTDVYALGVILYQLLTGGDFPYKVVGTMVDVLNNIINAQPTPPSARLDSGEADGQPVERRLKERHPAAINPAIEAIVMKALEKAPANRYQSAGELGKDLENYLAGLPTSARLHEPTRPRVSRRLSGKAVIVISAVAGSICIALAALIWALTRPSPPLANVAGEDLQTPPSQPSVKSVAMDNLRPGAVWKGFLTLPSSNNFIFALHITSRDGNKFTGYSLQGDGENRREAEGEVDGESVTWHETGSAGGTRDASATIDASGKKLTLTFTGRIGGKAELTLAAPPAASPTAGRRATFPPIQTRGSWQIDGKELVTPATIRARTIVFGDPEWSAYDLKFQALTETYPQNFGGVFHWHESNESCHFDFGAYSNRGHQITFARDGQMQRHTGAYRAGKVEADHWYDVRLEVRGSKYKLFLDGVEVIDDSNDDFTSGQVGLSAAGTSPVRFRNVTVTDSSGKTLWNSVPDPKGAVVLPTLPPRGGGGGRLGPPH